MFEGCRSLFTQLFRRQTQRSQAQDDVEERFPTRLAFGVWLVQFYNGIQYAEIFTLAAYVVRGLEGPDASEKRIGQLAGMLAGASSLSMGIAAWPWGRFSDTIGRKPIILFGNCWTASCIILFCSAKAYWVALLARFMAGILDGSVVMTKVMVGESCSPKMQGRVMSYLSLGDAMGQIIGPVMGGLLADPCDRFMKGTSFCGPSSQLIQRPYLLPGLVTACLGFSTTLLNILFMDETLPRKRTERGKGYRRLQDTEAADTEPEGGNTDLLPDPVESQPSSAPIQIFSGDCSTDLRNDGSLLPRGQSTSQVMTSRSHSQESKPIVAQKQAEVELQNQSSLAARQPFKTPGVDEQYSADDLDLDADGRESKRLLSSVTAAGPGEKIGKRGWTNSKDDIEKQAVEITEEEWYKNRPLLLSILVCSLMLSCAKYNDELGPIFVSAPISQGGLNISLDTFAVPLSVAGIMVTVFALFGYPALQAWAGLKLTCSTGLLLAIPGALILPTAYFWLSVPFLKMATIYIALAITKLATQISFTSSMVIINSIGPRSKLGDVNGVRMMMAALGRASGPLLGGYLWGLSATVKTVGHQFLGFILSSFALVGVFLLHNSIPLKIPE